MNEKQMSLAEVQEMLPQWCKAEIDQDGAFVIGWWEEGSSTKEIYAYLMHVNSATRDSEFVYESACPIGEELSLSLSSILKALNARGFAGE